MIWKLGNGRVHLIPAVHWLSHADLPIRSEYSKAYTRSDVIVFECNWSAPEVKPAKAISEETISAAGTQFAERVAQAVSQLGLAADVATMRPEEVSILISLKFGEIEGCTETHGLDQTLRNRAFANGKVVRYLESPSAAREVIGTVPFDSRVAALRAETDSLITHHERFRRTLAAWRSCNVDELAVVLSEFESESPALWGPVISGRSESWLPAILGILASGERALMCVGAFHCIGPRGLPALLTEKGVEVSYQ